MSLKIKFEFDQKIKTGQYSAKYFLVSKHILETIKTTNKSLLRFKHFHENVVVAGINEVIQLLQFVLNPTDFKSLKIYYLPDGTISNQDQPILAIEGDYKKFGFLENIIDSILSRRSSVATNAYNIVKLVGSQKVIYMADRSDDYSLQAYDGYSAYIGGIKKFVTNESVRFLKQADVKDYQVLGTIPHALIQQFKGDLAKTLIAFNNIYPNDKVIGLIDFHNDCLHELELLKLNQVTKLDYVRIDTSKKLVDKCLLKEYQKTKNPNLFGVNQFLIQKVRDKLDQLGYFNTKIIISSSVNPDQIKNYELNKIPVDIYGIGKYFMNIDINYTGDLIKLNDKYLAKEGRNENIDCYLANMCVYQVN